MLRNFLEHLFSRTSDNDCFWSYKIPLLVYMPVCYSVCLLSRFFLSFFLFFFLFFVFVLLLFFFTWRSGIFEIYPRVFGSNGPEMRFFRFHEKLMCGVIKKCFFWWGGSCFEGFSQKGP